MKKADTYTKTVLTYCIGAVVSSLLTVIAYLVVVNGVIFEAVWVLAFVMTLAVVQLIAQLYFFLHITEGEKPRWRLHALWFSAAMILIIVVGSIWIMKNLDYNMGMSPEQMHKYMLEENKKGF